MRLIFDFGNALAKWFNPSQETPIFGDFLHAIYKMTDAEWKSVVRSSTVPPGFIKVNGTGYAIGPAARRYVLREKPKGASRYTETYYGPAAAYAMVEAFGKSGDVGVYASHAPRDQRYSDGIVKVIKREWQVESHRGVMTFNVKKVITFDEPIGGYAHYALTKDGTERKDNSVARKTSLVIDVGGYTTDSAAIDPGGIIDPLSLKSAISGTMEAVSEFEERLKDRYRTRFQEAQGPLDIRRIEEAIITGVYRFGKLELDCKRESAAAIAGIVNDVIQIINAAGGAANYDIILLTGGGSALIYDALVAAFPHIEFIMVEPTRANMKYANVFGGAKIAKMITKVSGV